MEYDMKICIVGGGSAGWITLSYLAATTDCELTIIHSDDIETIGVGESTTPTIKYIADKIGVPEKEWLQKSDGTFKYGVEYLNWNGEGTRWFHSFDDLFPHQVIHTPLCDNGKMNYSRDLSSVDYYLKSRNGKGNSVEYNNFHGPMEYLVDNGLSPYDIDHRCTISNYPGYSYHVNAGKFADALKYKIPISRYAEIKKKVTDVYYDENRIKSVKLENNQTVEADIWFDCTGQRKTLISKFSSWIPYEGYLKNDRAIAGEIKFNNDDLKHDHYRYRPVTQAHAQDVGWIWSIPTRDRLGSGYVYCSNYIDDSKAELVIKEFWRKKGLEWNKARNIKFTAGRQHELAIGNVISNGLSQSFIEPLEATSLMITCTTVRAFEELYNKSKTWNSIKSKSLTKFMNRVIDHNKKFVEFHYRLSDRKDTVYWQSVAQGKDAVKELCDYTDSFKTDRWCEPGDTKFNQFNLISLLFGFDKEFTNDIENIDKVLLENYEHYVNSMRQHYLFLIRNNLTIKEYTKVFLQTD